MGISISTCCAAAHTSVPGGTATGISSIVRCTSPSFFSSSGIVFTIYILNNNVRLPHRTPTRGVPTSRQAPPLLLPLCVGGMGGGAFTHVGMPLVGIRGSALPHIFAFILLPPAGIVLLLLDDRLQRVA